LKFSDSSSSFFEGNELRKSRRINDFSSRIKIIVLADELNQKCYRRPDNVHQDPNGRSQRFRTIKRIFISIYFLEAVGASAITALGYVACRLLEIDWSRSAPLWFAGYLLVYNSDRLYPDPADATNTPLRSSWNPRLRSLRLALVWLSGGVLLSWPLVTARAWLLFPLAAAFGALWFYSRPMLRTGYRLKDLPYLKSLLAPGVVAGILVFWPACESGKLNEPIVWLVYIWVFLVLTINALVFDYRDISGDTAAGTKTIAVALGRDGTRRLLCSLAGVLVLVSVQLACLRLTGPLIPALLTLGCAGLLSSLRLRMPPALLSLLADVLLFLPAIGYWLG
jgi:4-hydroxybenzoate polyprenyltransferase